MGLFVAWGPWSSISRPYGFGFVNLFGFYDFLFEIVWRRRGQKDPKELTADDFVGASDGM
jgi:hypothetical protein